MFIDPKKVPTSTPIKPAAVTNKKKSRRSNPPTLEPIAESSTKQLTRQTSKKPTITIQKKTVGRPKSTSPKRIQKARDGQPTRSRTRSMSSRKNGDADPELEKMMQGISGVTKKTKLLNQEAAEFIKRANRQTEENKKQQKKS